jgi:LPXTG-motif cell wall-anchored protein
LSPYLGIGGLLLLGLLIFCLRRRRRNLFDGNFDPANITSVKGGGGGTLPNIDLGEGGIMGDGRGEGLIDEDDGMGGRLGAGAGGGGIIMPYAFVPPAPVGGAGVGGHPQMHQLSNVGGARDEVGVAAAAGYGNEKRAMRQQYAQHTPNASISSGSHYPTSSTNHEYFNASGVGSPEPQSPTSDEYSSIGGNVFGGVNYRPLSRHSPGPSVLTSSSGGKNAKEMEAMGRAVVVNPDDVPGVSGFQQAYLQSGPGPHHQQHLPSSSSTPVPTRHSPTLSRAGTAVVVHEDGGRVVLSKGDGEGEAEALNTEIPPTYDSLPVDLRRES